MRIRTACDTLKTGISIKNVDVSILRRDTSVSDAEGLPSQKAEINLLVSVFLWLAHFSSPDLPVLPDDVRGGQEGTLIMPFMLLATSPAFAK